MHKTAGKDHGGNYNPTHGRQEFTLFPLLSPFLSSVPTTRGGVAAAELSHKEHWTKAKRTKTLLRRQTLTLFCRGVSNNSQSHSSETPPDIH